MVRKLILLDHDGGELANQLWNHIAILAYALELGSKFENWSFFEYAHYFRGLEPGNTFLRSIFFIPFRRHHGRRSSIRVWMARRLYKLLVVLPARFFSQRVVFSNTHTPVFMLPPSKYDDHLAGLEKSNKPIYFLNLSGGTFRNPLGEEKHANTIRQTLSAADDVQSIVKETVGPLRQAYKLLVGVHIRQGDYRTWKSGRFWIEQDRAREILNEFLSASEYLPQDVCFVIASDGPITEQRFSGLQYFISRHNAGVDLFLLAQCDLVIGSHSTFGKLAAWLGNIPHITMQKGKIDWPYYHTQKAYFEDKHFSFIVL